MKFSDFLRSSREELGITCKQLAESVQISKRTIENWEQGRTEPPPYMQAQIEKELERKKQLKRRKKSV